MSVITVEPLARLAIGVDADGRIKSNLAGQEQESAFAKDLATHTREITVAKTADCMDDRPTIALGDGSTDQNVLDSRVVWQLPGGLALATTKAGIAANAAYLRDAKDFTDAYVKTFNILTEMGYQDGGHEGCGASKLVEKSVAEPVEREILLPTIEAILSINSQMPQFFDPKKFTSIFDKVTANKQRKLDAGFYSNWSAAWHEDFLMQMVPQNFSRLQTAQDTVHGHYADGIEVIAADRQGMGFAKNAFYRATGKMAFGVTEEPMVEIAHKLGGTSEERSLILLGFADDLPNVSTHLLAKGMPVFKAVA